MEDRYLAAELLEEFTPGCPILVDTMTNEAALAYR